MVERRDSSEVTPCGALLAAVTTRKVECEREVNHDGYHESGGYGWPQWALSKQEQRAAMTERRPNEVSPFSVLLEDERFQAGVDHGFAIGINESTDHGAELLALRKEVAELRAVRVDKAKCDRCGKRDDLVVCSDCSQELHGAPAVRTDYPNTAARGPETCCWDRIVEPGTPDDPGDPPMPYVCTLPKGHAGELHEHEEHGDVFARWVVKDGQRRFVTIVFTDTEEYQRYLGIEKARVSDGAPDPHETPSILGKDLKNADKLMEAKAFQERHIECSQGVTSGGLYAVYKHGSKCQHQDESFGPRIDRRRIDSAKDVTK